MSKSETSICECNQGQSCQVCDPVLEPVAVIRFERNKPGNENEMPKVISCNRLPDGDYQVFLAPQPTETRNDGFGMWLENPYTKVLEKSIKEDYVPQPATPESTGPCSLGVGCEEYGVCYAEAHDQPEKCGKLDPPTDPAQEPSDEQLYALWNEIHMPFGKEQFKVSHVDYSRALLARYGNSRVAQKSAGQIMEAVKSYGDAYRQSNITVSEQEMRLHGIRALMSFTDK